MAKTILVVERGRAALNAGIRTYLEKPVSKEVMKQTSAEFIRSEM